MPRVRGHQGAGLRFSHHTCGAMPPRPRPVRLKPQRAFQTPVTDQAASVPGAGTSPSHPAVQEPGLMFRCPAWSPDVGGQARPTGWGAVKRVEWKDGRGAQWGQGGSLGKARPPSWAWKVGEGPGGERWTPTHPALHPSPQEGSTHHRHLRAGSCWLQERERQRWSVRRGWGAGGCVEG